MTPRSGPESGFGLGNKYFALGLRFAGGVVVFALGGLALDRWLGTTPLGTVVGTLLGATLSFISVYRVLMADEARQREKDRPTGKGAG